MGMLPSPRSARQSTPQVQIGIVFYFGATVFLVTSDGVIVTDPIHTEAATWLEAGISKRFNQPIRI